MALINSEIYIKKLTNILNELDCKELDIALGLIEEAWKNGKQIITLGNGGSSLTALHFINDWNKSVYLRHG